MISRSFGGVYIRNAEKASAMINSRAVSGKPVILCANHSNWWDAAMVVFLTFDVLKSDSFCLMEKKQFDQHGFFGKIGAIPIVREDAAGSIRLLKQCADEMNGRGKSLWIFPQGEIVPAGSSDHKFFNGISYLASVLDQPAIQFAYFNYRFLKDQHPVAIVDFFSANENAEVPRSGIQDFTSSLEKMYDNHETELNREISRNDLSGFKLVLAGRKTLGKR